MSNKYQNRFTGRLLQALQQGVGSVGSHDLSGTYQCHLAGTEAGCQRQRRDGGANLLNKYQLLAFRRIEQEPVGMCTALKQLAGTALTAIAQARSFGGPNLTADTTDVTTHDSTGAFEEMVVTILRTGEVTMGLVYDPANATHDASTGLLFRYENKVRTNFSLIFADTGSTVWAFSGDITAFTPDMAHDSSLDAAATIKISGQPTLV